MNIEHLFTNNPYRLNAEEKQKLLAKILWKLTLEHKNRCLPYQRILEALPISLSPTGNLEDIPMLPVRLFKTRAFRSVPQDSVLRILTSSATTAQIPSYIFVDKETANLEVKAFSSVVTSVIGKAGFPAILVDTPSVAEDKNTLSVRGYVLRGWDHLSSDCLFLLDDSMNIRWEELDAFLKKYNGQRIILFGFTFIIWQHLYRPLSEKKRRLDLADSILFHTGGWKKLEEIAVDNETFKLKLCEQLGLSRIHNFYGMAELIGVIFLECEEAHLHTPDFADVIIRDPNSLKPLPRGYKGLIQVLNPLALSYPGHSLLTEDLGEVLGEDDCPCGRKGKYLRIHGRMPWAEIRGCSNVYAQQFYSENDS